MDVSVSLLTRGRIKTYTYALALYGKKSVSSTCEEARKYSLDTAIDTILPEAEVAFVVLARWPSTSDGSGSPNTC
jgi:hypothetical protein